MPGPERSIRQDQLGELTFKYDQLGGEPLKSHKHEPTWYWLMNPIVAAFKYDQKHEQVEQVGTYL